MRERRRKETKEKIRLQKEKKSKGKDKDAKEQTKGPTAKVYSLSLSETCANIRIDAVARSRPPDVSYGFSWRYR